MNIEVLGKPVQLTGNDIWIKISGGSAPGGAVDYKYMLKLFSTDGQIPGAPFVDAIAPDENGEAFFNISGLVDIPFPAVFEYPPVGAIRANSAQTLKVQVQAGESWINENGLYKEEWGPTAPEFQLLKGGLTSLQNAMFSDDNTTFYDVFVVGKRFLTSRPWGDYVHPTQPIKLYFMAFENISANFTISCYYFDGTSDVFSTAVVLGTSSLFEFNCNPALHGKPMINSNGSRMNFFDVALKSGNSNVSDDYRFHVDWKFCERPFFMLFANSFGGIDDFYFSGFAKQGIKAEGEIVYKPQGRNATVLDPTLITPNRTGQDSWTINTGYKSSSTLRYLRNLIMARQAWLLFPNLAVSSYRVIPVIITNTDTELMNYQEDLNNIDIEMIEAHSSPFSLYSRMY